MSAQLYHELSNFFCLGNVNVTAFTLTQHTVLPEGFLELNYTSQHKGVQQFTLDIFSSALTVQQTLQALNSEITVSLRFFYPLNALMLNVLG